MCGVQCLCAWYVMCVGVGVGDQVSVVNMCIIFYVALPW